MVKHCPFQSSYFQFLFWQHERFGLLTERTFFVRFLHNTRQAIADIFSVIIGRHVYKILSPNDGNAENDT